MLRLVTAALGSARPDIKLGNTIAIEQQPGRHDQHAMDGTLPGGARVRFATALWSDIAQVKEGFLSMMAAVLLGGFGVRYFAEVGSNTGHMTARIIHLLLTWMIQLLALFLLPLTMCMMVFGLVAVLAFYLFGHSTLWMQTPFIVAVGLTAVIMIARFGHSYLREASAQRSLIRPVLHIFVFIAMAFSILLLLGIKDYPEAPYKLGLGGRESPQSAAIVDGIVWFAQLLQHWNWADRARRLDQTGIYFGLLYALQDLGGLVEILLAMLVLVLLLVAWIDRRIEPHTRRSLLLSCVCVVSMWIVMLLLLWPEKIITSIAMSHYSIFKPGEEIPLKSAIGFDFGTWEIWRPARYVPSNYYQALWFDWVFLVFLLLTGAVIVGLLCFRLGANWLRSKGDLSAFKPEPGMPAPRKGCWPRLVISPAYVVMVLGLMSFAVSVVLIELAQNSPALTERLPIGKPGDAIPHEVIINYGFMVPAVLAAIFGFLVIASTIRDSVKLMLDVVNHFVAPHLETEKAFPVRRKIAQRLVDTLDFLTRDGDKPHLVIIAHSQGTVITLDTIFGSLERDGALGRPPGSPRRSGVWTGTPDGWPACLQERVASLTIMTFGSPVTNVYQHYFGHMYQPFKNTAITAIARDPRVKWFNTYRIDDFVGPYIDNSIPDFPVNVPMPIGGHTRYWEQEVFKALFEDPKLSDVLVARA